MNRKTRAKVIFGGFAVAIFVTCIIAVRLANRSLMAADARRLPCADADYAWSSNNEVISFISKSAIVPAWYDPTVQETVVKVSAEMVGIASGLRSPLNEFHTQLPDQNSTDTEHWTVSPDGTRLLYGAISANPDYDGSTPSLSVWTFDNDEEHAVDNDVYAGIDYAVQSVMWMPDSTLLLIAKDDSGHTAALYNTESQDDSSVAIPMAVHTPIGLGVTPNNHLIYTDFTDPHPNGIAIFDQEIGAGQGAMHEYTPKLPSGVTVNEIALSPKGNKLAWITSSIYTPPGYSLIRKVFPRLAARIAPYPVVSIYVSKLDGEEMGFIGMENNPPSAPDEVVRNVRWRPDGKWLSFRWRKGVYMVEAD